MAGSAGWAKFGINKTRVTFSMPHPPAFYAPNREIKLAVIPADPNAAAITNDFQGMLEQELRQLGFKPMATAPTVLEVTFRAAEGRVVQEKRTESVNVHVGTHTETDKKGKTKEVEDCKSRDARVTYLESSGRLLLEVQATDAASRPLLAPESIERAYQMESAISGPRQCGDREYHLKEDQITDSYAILQTLAGQAIPRMIQLAAGYDEPLTVMVAVDDELKPGNVQAQASNWQGAFDVWTQADINKQETEAARQYNLGVAHEALAALAIGQSSLDEAARHLDDADACYRQALQLDPSEKYFRDAPSRVQSARALLRVTQDYESGKQLTEAAMTPALSGASNSMTLGFPIDGWPEGENQTAHDYRAYVRQRMVSRGRANRGGDFTQTLAADAHDYQIQPDVARRVIESETARLQLLDQNVSKYQELVKDVTADGVITKGERAILETRRKTLHLSVEEARQAESQFHFRGER